MILIALFGGVMGVIMLTLGLGALGFLDLIVRDRRQFSYRAYHSQSWTTIQIRNSLLCMSWGLFLIAVSIAVFILENRV